MKIRGRALKRAAFITSVAVAIHFASVDFARADFGTCGTDFKELLERHLPPSLTWRRPGQSVKARAAQAAKVTNLSRLRAETKIIPAGDPYSSKALSNLQDGIYVWGVDRKGRIAVLNRNMDPGTSGETSQFLGSHSGLMRVLRNEPGGKNTSFVATGEIVRRNGRTMVVDNASGTYPGGAENLDYGIRRLRSAGLEVDDRTQIQDLSRSKTYDPHDAAYLQVPIEIRVNRDPKLKALHEETKRVMEKVDRVFTDRFTLMLAMQKVPLSNGWSPYQASYILDRWSNPTEGTAYVFETIYRQAGSDEKFRALLEALEKTADSNKGL